MSKHENIDEYIKDCTKDVVPLIEELRAFIHSSLPGAAEGMQYGAPVFYNARNASVIYLYGAKDHVNVGFLKSAELSDPKGILKGSGKPSKHIEISVGEKIDKSMLRNFITQCQKIEPKRVC